MMENMTVYGDELRHWMGTASRTGAFSLRKTFPSYNIQAVQRVKKNDDTASGGLVSFWFLLGRGRVFMPSVYSTLAEQFDLSDG